MLQVHDAHLRHRELRRLELLDEATLARRAALLNQKESARVSLDALAVRLAEALRTLCRRLRLPVAGARPAAPPASVRLRGEA